MVALRMLTLVALVISILVSTVSLAIYLVREGERGNFIAGSLSLLVSIAALVWAIFIWLFEKDYIPRPELPQWASTLMKRLAMLFLLGILVTAGYFTTEVLKTPDIPITEVVRLTGSEEMVDGSEALVGIPEPARRAQLALIPKLRNNEPTGNCVGSAIFDSRLLVDGVVRQSVKGTRPFSEVRFLLGEPVQTASVAITVQMRDPACQVDLLVHEAVLFSDTWW